MNSPETTSSASDSPYSSADQYNCPKCQQGTLKATVIHGEPEYNDTFACNHCQYSTTIPSLQIIFSQLFSGIFGGALSGYLFVIQLNIILTAYQLNKDLDVTRNYLQFAFAIIFLLCFGFVVYKGMSGIKKRRSVYKHAIKPKKQRARRSS